MTTETTARCSQPWAYDTLYHYGKERARSAALRSRWKGVVHVLGSVSHCLDELLRLFRWAANGRKVDLRQVRRSLVLPSLKECFEE